MNTQTGAKLAQPLDLFCNEALKRSLCKLTKGRNV